MSVNPVSTVTSAFMPHRPCGVTLNPFFLSVLALDLVRPVLSQKTARFAFDGSKPSPNSSAISASALSIIS